MSNPTIDPKAVPFTNRPINMMNDLLSLSHIPRWTVVRTFKPQSVADHTYRVAVIAHELAYRFIGKSLVPMDMHALLWWALVHDLGESITGDIPGHAKELIDFPSVPAPWKHVVSPSYEIAYTVKLADLIEAYTWLLMNGTGNHASRVASLYLRPRLFAKAESCQFLDPVWVVSTVTKLVDEILAETGRDHFPLPPPK